MSSSDSSFSVIKSYQYSVSVSHEYTEELTLLLSSLRRSLGGTTSSGGRGTTSGGSGTTSGSDVQEQLLDVLALEGLGEERGPDGLDVGDFGGGDEGLELVGLRKYHVLGMIFAADPAGCGILRTVISTPSSARMRAA